MSDARGHPRFPSWAEVEEDEKAMVIRVGYLDGQEFPAKFEVCDLCDGRGTHVNPPIDSHGLSGEDFAEDPEFAEDCRSGVYDVECARCGGRRVVLSPATEEGWAALREIWDSESSYRAEVEAERRMGA